MTSARRFCLVVGFLSCALLVGGCRQNPSDGSPPTPPAADAANVDERSLYEVDPEDPYLIFNGTFFDFAPGQPFAPAAARLQEGRLETGEGSFEVFYINGDGDGDNDDRGRDGAAGAEPLGYLLRDPSDPTRIGDIVITSERAVTEQGIRVGRSYAELVEQLGALEVHGSEVEGYTYALHDGLKFRLDAQHYDYDLPAGEVVSPQAKVIEIVIARR